MWKFICDKISTILGSSGFVGFIITQIQNKKNKKLDNEKALKAKNEQLEKEIVELKTQLSKYEDVEKSTTGNYLILKETGMPICPVCWGNEHKAIPIYETANGRYYCSICKRYDTYSFNKVAENGRRYKQADEEISDRYIVL